MAKICMVGSVNYHGDARVRREAEALTSRGDKVDVICLRDSQTRVTRTLNGVRLYPLAVSKYRGGNRLLYLLHYISFFIQAIAAVTYLFVMKRYDVVQVHTMPDSLVFAAIVPKVFGARVILDVHDLMPELFMSKFAVGYDHFLVRILKGIERLSIKFADNAIAVHLPHRDILIKHGNPPDKLRVLLNLPDPRVFASAKKDHRRDDEKFRLLYHGTIARRHGLEVALRAMPMILETIPNVELTIAGDGDDRARLIAFAGSLGLLSVVKFSHGVVPLEDIPSIIRQADIGIVPMLDDSFTQYVLPVKLLEYVELGIPVVASRTDSILFYFDDNMVRYFEPGDVSALARHVTDLYQHPQKRVDLVRNAKKFTNRFSWEKQKQIYYKLIDNSTKTRGE